MDIDILINGEKAEFSDSDFPLLISGAEKRGVSFFSVCLMAKLANSGRKIIFFSAYPSAKEELRKQLMPGIKEALIIESGEESDFIKSLSETDDLAERIVLVKNFDRYSPKLFEAVKGLKKIIFAGNLDNCCFADQLLQSGLAAKIFFSQSEKDPQIGLNECPRYEGRIFSAKRNGAIKLSGLSLKA